MSFNWSEYLILAQDLASRSTTSPIQEANLRAAISRAYYSVFCQARNHLINKDRKRIRPNADAHKFVAESFEKSRNKNRQRIGFLLHDLRANRNLADYKDTLPYGDKSGKTKALLAEAEEILLSLHRL